MKTALRGSSKAALFDDGNEEAKMSQFHLAQYAKKALVSDLQGADADGAKTLKFGLGQA